MIKNNQIPQIVRSPVTKKWYVVTRYKWLDKDNGHLESIDKHDVTKQIEEVLANVK